MKEVIKYVADDGKEFTYEEDCYEYEQTLYCKNLTENDIKVWDGNGKRIELLPDTINNIEYVEFLTEKGWDVFNDMCVKNGDENVEVYFVYNPGLYYYGEDGGWHSWEREWVNLLAIRSKLQ